MLEIFLTFLRLGLTSFGGPIAHLSYFHDEFVKRKKWIDEHTYADLVSLCQFLPGPASSQVGIAIGLSRKGVLGAIVAWLGFTLPSAIILVLFGLRLSTLSDHLGLEWLHGLKVVAVAVVAQAIWAMGTKLCPDKERITIAIIATILVLNIPFAVGQIGVILLGGIYGLFFLKKSNQLPHAPIQIHVSHRTGSISLILFFLILFFLPIIAQLTDIQALKLFSGFFRAGSLVFGGGHVVLPLLQSEVVSTGLVSNDVFLAGYGAAQAIPGPLFTFSAYLGAVSQKSPSGWFGAALCLIAVFLPSFLLVIGIFPFWEKLKKNDSIKNAMAGINAAVVGLLLAAFYKPVWTSAILSPKDFSLAIGTFLLLTYWKTPTWVIVIVAAFIAQI